MGVLLAAVGCTGPAGDPETAPAGVPTGAPPMTPHEALPTYADGTEPAATASPSSSVPGADEAATAEVVVTYAEWDGSARAVDVGGYVQGAIVSDGRCSVRLNQASVVLTGVGEAYPDRSTTACSAIRVPLPDGASGTWDGVLQFDAGPITGESSFTVTVR